MNPTYLQRAIHSACKAAREEEREACAKTAEGMSPGCHCDDHEAQRRLASEIATAIRARTAGTTDTDHD